MSMLRPKDGDYITRGILLLLGWYTIGWVISVVVGAALFVWLIGPHAALPGATVFFGLHIPAGVGLYWIYLNWSDKNL